MWETGDVYMGVWWGDPKRPLEHLGVDGRIIYNGSSRSRMRRHGLD
jgi:hypothetical protein